MASDNHAHYGRIGFTVFIGVVAIAATLVYLGGFRDHRKELLVETYYEYSVSGLSVGSPVNMMGVKIGEVREISFAFDTYGDDPNLEASDAKRVIVLMAISKEMLGCVNDPDELIAKRITQQVDHGLRAMVVSSGVTGLSRIEFQMVENCEPPVLPKWRPRHQLVPSAPSLFENFSVTATKMLHRLQQMDFVSAWSNVLRTADAAANVAEQFDMAVDSEKCKVRELLSNVEEISESLKEMTQVIKSNPSLLLRPSDPERLEETNL